MPDSYDLPIRIMPTIASPRYEGGVYYGHSAGEAAAKGISAVLIVVGILSFILVLVSMSIANQNYHYCDNQLCDDMTRAHAQAELNRSVVQPMPIIVPAPQPQQIIVQQPQQPRVIYQQQPQQQQQRYVVIRRQPCCGAHVGPIGRPYQQYGYQQQCNNPYVGGYPNGCQQYRPPMYRRPMMPPNMMFGMMMHGLMMR